MYSSSMPLWVLGLAFQAVTAQDSASISVSDSVPAGAGIVIPEAFLSYALEFAFFPDYAGNSTHPNTFSNNLLNNIGNLTGTKPYIRVGGNTQDYALYNASLPVATNGTIIPSKSADYPTILYIGPSFFDSYSTWPDTKYIHGFSLGLGGNNSAGWQTLIDTIPLACKALSGGKLLWWEYGNEPDLYSTSAQGPVRPPSWNEREYVEQWLNGTKAIKAGLAEHCPDLLEGDNYGYIAPSFAGTNNHLNPITTWQDGLDVNQDIKLISSHNYIGGATQPGVTLQHTLMNHTSTLTSLASQANESSLLSSYNIPYILGETNSLYNEGKPGLSNAFGAALWGIDFSLASASLNISRIHFQQGTSFRYDSWQPVESESTTIGTKPPYYGNIAVAATVEHGTQVVDLSEDAGLAEEESAYAIYRAGRLEKLAVINMREYNYTVGGLGVTLNTETRPVRNYTFLVDGGVGETPAGMGKGVPTVRMGGSMGVQRLYANGSDAITGITWDGWSYNWELEEGRPVRLGNVTVGESLQVVDGKVTVEVEDSGFALLEF